jgi:hypothetical protein
MAWVYRRTYDATWRTGRLGVCGDDSQTANLNQPKQWNEHYVGLVSRQLAWR